MGQNAARRLTDEQLRSHELRITNPGELEGLSTDRPDTEFPPVIMGEYHLGGSQPPVRCCFCVQKTRHRKGFVVQFKPPTLHLIGSTCGPSHLNLQFGAATRSHMELVNRQTYLRRFDFIVSNLARWVDACNAVLFSEELQGIERKGEELKETAGDAYMRLHALAVGGSSLSEEVDVRDFEAERRRDERTADDEKRPPIYRKEAVAIGVLAGRALLQAGYLRSRVHAFKKAVNGLAALMRGATDGHATSKLKNEWLSLERLHGEANEAIDAINKAHEFFSATHLHLLARWSASNSTDTLSAGQGGLLVENRGRPARLLSALSAASVSPVPDLIER